MCTTPLTMHCTWHNVVPTRVPTPLTAPPTVFVTPPTTPPTIVPTPPTTPPTTPPRPPITPPMLSNIPLPEIVFNSFLFNFLKFFMI
ncbi:MAG TPA: hypothetical protein DEB71_17140 [Chryseobacterium carnipullorum]|nr:hypothetical protein [Chryseobacterium carnipullorum]